MDASDEPVGAGAAPAASSSIPSVIYDRIGRGYAEVRRPDPRIEQQLHQPLGHVSQVLNVGAGSGSYEPTDRLVIAVEPSDEMIGQRPDGAAPVVRAVGEALPFADQTFDGAMALLTIHHWPDAWAGLVELRRVTTGPIVVLTFDIEVHDRQWLCTDYLPALRTLDRQLLSPSEIVDALGGGSVEVLPVPHDCADGFCHAWWRRPEAYLRPEVRAGISGIARLPLNVVQPAMATLAEDLATGVWHRRHADLLSRTEIDAGYRIVVSSSR